MPRLDEEITKKRLATTRSQAENLIRLGHVKVNGRVVKKPGHKVHEKAQLEVERGVSYVSRAALKLKSAAESFELDFKGSVVLDVGSSTGGFTEYALMQGAKKVVAVDVGTNQMHPKLSQDPRVELHEKTDIRDVYLRQNVEATAQESVVAIAAPDIALVDVSFISLREVIPAVCKLLTPNSRLIAMLKPQFEAGDSKKHKGVIKNNTMRRKIIQDFEDWAKQYMVILDKKDSEVSGKKGNVERFYLLKLNDN